MPGHRPKRRCPGARLGAVAASLVALLACGEPAPSGATALKAEETGRAVEIVDGDTLVLDDGREVRLVGIQAPKLPLGRRGFEPWPLSPEAKAALAELALDETLQLAYGGSKIDRHGRALAHLYRRDGLWIQGRLLERGMARVYSFVDNRALVAEMLALERQARAERRGIWADPFYALRAPRGLAADIGSFQLVEGRVFKTAEVRGRVFLNFAADWRRDFTVSLDRAAARLFRAEGLEPLDLEGRLIRVRGWLKEENGPMIEATHPEQIEILED